MYLFSNKTLAFYPVVEIQLYLDAGTLPDDVIEVSEDVRNIYNALPPEGMRLGAGNDGLPAWVKKSKIEYIADAEFLRTAKIDQANLFMSGKQWPGKASLGRLKGNDMEQYGLWLDYLDALEAVDANTAPDIEWPITPE